MILASANGVILRTEGDNATSEAAASIRLMTGASWSEGSCGTNAIGTALSAGGPVQIHASEHFCAGIKPWTCGATVVRDPSDGTALGILDVSGLSGVFNKHLLALVVAAAGRIETELAVQEMALRERLLEHGLRRLPKSGSGGLILFDTKGRLVKTDNRAGPILAAIGIEPDVRPRVRIDALDARGPKHSDATLPGWLHPEWIQSIVEGGEQLGTLVILPERFGSIAEPTRGALPKHKLRRAEDFVQAHIDQPIRLEELAAAAAVSPFHFHRQFKKATGMTPHEYILRTRIERAKELLSGSELPLVEVAAQVGYADQSHFTSTFRKMTSVTPRGYRNATSA
jgi:AraC-like DNA-binding protein